VLFLRGGRRRWPGCARHVLVAYYEVNGGEDPRLVALEQLGKCRFAAGQVEVDERGVARLHGFHKELRVIG